MTHEIEETSFSMAEPIEEINELNLLKNNLKDEILNLFMIHSKTVELYYEINDNSYEIFNKITESEFKEFNVSSVTQQEIIEKFHNFKNQFSNSYLLFFKYKYKFKSLPHINELKDLLIKIDEYISTLIDKNIKWFIDLNERLITANKNSKYLKFFTNIDNYNFIRQIESIHKCFKESEDTLSQLSNNFKAFNKSHFKTSTKLIVDISLKLQEKIQIFEKIIKLQSPIYQNFEKLARIDEMISFQEFYFERKLSEIGNYQPEAKKATKKVINKNLMSILKVIFEVSPILEKINDVVIWICKNYIIHINNLGVNDNDLNELSDKLKELLQSTYLNSEILMEDFYSNLLTNLIKSDKPDYLRKIKILVTYLSKNTIIFTNFVNLNFKFNKLNKTLNSNFKNIYVYSIFDQQFSSFNSILKNMMEIIERNSNGDLDKFIKNDIMVLELYQLSKEVPRLGGCIDLNQLNTKKIINDDL